ncbi:unnamed protein product [Prunus brigantina]
MEEDNSQGGVADKARPDAKEQASEACMSGDTALERNSIEFLVYNGRKACHLPALSAMEVRLVACQRMSGT